MKNFKELMECRDIIILDRLRRFESSLDFNLEEHIKELSKIKPEIGLITDTLSLYDSYKKFLENRSSLCLNETVLDAIDTLELIEIKINLVIEIHNLTSYSLILTKLIINNIHEVFHTINMDITYDENFDCIFNNTKIGNFNILNSMINKEIFIYDDNSDMQIFKIEKIRLRDTDNKIAIISYNDLEIEIDIKDIFLLKLKSSNNNLVNLGIGTLFSIS